MKSACFATMKLEDVTRMILQSDGNSIVGLKNNWLVSATGQICYDIPNVGQICPVQWSKTKAGGVGVGIENFYGLGVLMGGDAMTDEKKSQGMLRCNVGWGLLAGGVSDSRESVATLPLTAKHIADEWARQVHQKYNEWLTKKDKKGKKTRY